MTGCFDRGQHELSREFLYMTSSTHAANLKCQVQVLCIHPLPLHWFLAKADAAWPLSSKRRRFLSCIGPAFLLLQKWWLLPQPDCLACAYPKRNMPTSNPRGAGW